MTYRSMLAFALFLVGPPLFAADEAPKPLSVLFLGDQGHHVPAQRFEQLGPVLENRGIRATYTERVADLNPENLAKYDAVLVYANIDQIGPDEEKALIDYVEQGGGFVPIHCASFCFLNSQKYIDLVGAQFQRHGTGEFDTKVVDPAHPTMASLEPFRTWDETYVHHKHNTRDRHVLQVRAEGAQEEPWTWVRTQGKGRVFYTAYGHDHRTFGHPGFHDLIERGIRWAARKGDVFDSRPRVAAGLKPFSYVDAGANIPQYLPGRNWGAQGDPIKTMQSPLSPAESMPHLAVPREFQVELFASEPEITKPICMNWDHLGRLWIAETTDYPNNKQPRGGHDRIKVIEDTDGDGKADKFTVFADDLSIPTSLIFVNGGVVVHQAPQTLFLKDTDGDGKADVRKVLFTGWDVGDTHAGPSNLRYGLDNWLWSMDGYAGFSGTVGGEQVRFRQGFFRFRPDGSKMEFIRNTNNNSWGVGFSEEGLVFGSTANGCPSVFMPIPNRYYESVRGMAPTVLGNIADSYRFFPLTDKVRQVDFFGGFTAGAGHALYTARTYPRNYWNRTAFVAEPTGHLVSTFTLHPHGSNYTSHNAWNLVASNDEWTSPIMAEVGPDGNVWVIDWYNYIVQHNPTPEGFKTGKGSAYETPLRDKTHGRIYRIVAKGAKPSAITKLDPADANGLVAALKNDNMFWRTHAQRLLVERGQKDVVPGLVALVKDGSVDEIGLNPGAIHALWTLHGLGALDGTIAEATAAANSALTHASAGVRRNAAQVLAKDADAAKAIVAAKLLEDDDAQVRLAALLSLADRPASDEAAAGIVKALVSGKLDRDRPLADAATSAAAANAKPFLAALAAQKFDGPASELVTRIATRVAEHYARGGPDDTVVTMIKALPNAEPGVSAAIISGIAAGWPKARTVTLDEAAEKALGELVARLPAQAKGEVVILANTWGSKGFEKYTAEIAASFLEIARDESRPEADRVKAATQLIEFQRNNVQAAEELLGLVNPRTTPVLATGLMEAVGRSASPEIGKLLVDRMDALTPSVRPVALRLLLGRTEWTAAMMDGVEAGKLALSSLSLDQTQALAAHSDKSIAQRAKDLIARGGGLPDADREKVIAAISPAVLKGGNPARGKAIFTEQCAKCHLHGNEGGKVGPDLTGMAAHPRSELLIHILDPSRSVEGNFVQYNVALNDGRVLNGLLASETKTSIELLDAEGKSHTILREDIEELASSRKSLMPEGFEKQVPPEGMADLLAFLTQRGKYLPLDLRKAATIVSTQGMFFDKNARAERLVFPDWSPKTFEGVPFQLVDPQGDRVPNVIMLNGPHGTYPPQMPKSVSLPVNAPAKAFHFLSGVSGWGAQSPTPDGSTSMIVKLHYSDGEVEEHPLRDGVEFADYIRPVDVPGSKLAFRLRGQQIRYFAVHPKRAESIEQIELVKGPDDTAPVVMAITAESAE